MRLSVFHFYALCLRELRERMVLMNWERIRSKDLSLTEAQSTQRKSQSMATILELGSTGFLRTLGTWGQVPFYEGDYKGREGYAPDGKSHES